MIYVKLLEIMAASKLSGSKNYQTHLHNSRQGVMILRHNFYLEKPTLFLVMTSRQTARNLPIE